jgi:2-amino-4-hydroxy-6-hydroxymethyldihydropteridine diphosphokinase
MLPRTRAFIGFGANLGDPFTTMPLALKALAALPETGLAACSSYYRSAPLGVSGSQPDYINAAIALDTGLPPLALLGAMLGIEAACGRRRTAGLAPRPLDLDLLLYGDAVMQTPMLALPHPRLHQRAFVLLPLAEIAPGLSILGLAPISLLLDNVKGQRIARIPGIRLTMPASRGSGEDAAR